MAKRLPFLLLVASGFAWGDGAFIWSDTADLLEPSQVALIYWRDGEETLILQVDFEGPTSEFAWIVPLPSAPEVTVLSEQQNPLPELSYVSQERAHMNSEGASEADIQVIMKRDFGIYSCVTLRSGETSDVIAWLSANGYKLPPGKESVLDPYAKKGWVFVAMRVKAGFNVLRNRRRNRWLGGSLDCVKFVFPSKEIVYPLHISSMNGGTTQVLIYLLGEAPIIGGKGPKAGSLSIEKYFPWFWDRLLWRGDVRYGVECQLAKKQIPITCRALGLRSGGELFLTEFRAEYKPEEMTEDLSFKFFDPVEYWFQRVQIGSFEDEDALRAYIVLSSHFPRLLRTLAGSALGYVRKAVAEHPLTPPEVLELLSRDELESVRVQATRHPALPALALERLARDRSKFVRANAAAREDVPVSVLRLLQNDASDTVLRAIVQNPRTPVDVLESIARRKLEPDVAVRLLENPRLPGPSVRRLWYEWKTKGDPNVLGAAAANPNVPLDVLCQLAFHKDSYVRGMAAANTKTPAEFLMKLARDESTWVRCHVAENKNVPRQALVQLASDPDPRVRRSVASNEAASQEILEALSKDPKSGVRAAVGANPAATLKLLRALAVDPQPGVRLAVAENPRTPQEILVELTSDKHQSVSTFAKAAILRRRQQAARAEIAQAPEEK